MIICLESSVLGGYLSNEVPGLITGLFHLAGRSTPMRIELEGNFLQDIAGCRVDFHNPCPEADTQALSLWATHWSSGTITPKQRRYGRRR